MWKNVVQFVRAIPSEKWTVLSFATMPLLVCWIVNAFAPQSSGNSYPTPDDFLYCLGIIIAIGAWSFSGSPLASRHRYRLTMLFFGFLVLLYSLAGYTALTVCTGARPGIGTLAGAIADAMMTCFVVAVFLIGNE